MLRYTVGEEVEIVADFEYLVSKIFAHRYCSHEIKRRPLLLRRKAVMNLNSVLRGRDLTLTTKIYIVRSMIFPVIMYCCENWSLRKLNTDEFDIVELWCWRRILRVPWTAFLPAVNSVPTVLW